MTLAEGGIDSNVDIPAIPVVTVSSSYDSRENTRTSRSPFRTGVLQNMLGTASAESDCRKTQ